MKRMRVVAERLEASLKNELIQLRTQMAQAAQQVYDEWEQDEEGIDEVLGAGGPCDQIAQALAGIVVTNTAADVTDGGQAGADHAWTIAYTNNEAYGIDIPPSTYESGGGYCWQKITDVKFTLDDIEIFPIPVEDILPYGEG